MQHCAFGVQARPADYQLLQGLSDVASPTRQRREVALGSVSTRRRQRRGQVSSDRPSNCGEN